MRAVGSECLEHFKYILNVPSLSKVCERLLECCIMKEQFHGLQLALTRETTYCVTRCKCVHYRQSSTCSLSNNCTHFLDIEYSSHGFCVTLHVKVTANTSLDSHAKKSIRHCHLPIMPCLPNFPSYVASSSIPP